MDKSLCGATVKTFHNRWQTPGPAYTCAILPTIFTLNKGATIFKYAIFADCAVTSFWCSGVTTNSGQLIEQPHLYPSETSAINDLPNFLP